MRTRNHLSSPRDEPAHSALVRWRALSRALCGALWLVGSGGCTHTAPLEIAPPFDGAPLARGSVFLDEDGDGIRDAGEAGLAGVAVSDGEFVVETNREGNWALPARPRATYFVIKPSGMRTPLDANQLPRFYYLHREAGSGEPLRYGGIAPTGPLPSSIDFALVPQAEPKRFRVVIMGDPQPFDREDVDHLTADILPELAEVDAAFGVSLGDIVHDDLALYPTLIDAMGLVGIPWFHVFGNHDMDLDASRPGLAGETFERYFGPRNFAFEYADVHFVVLDDIDFRPRSEEEEVGYRGGISDRTLRFLENYLARVPGDEAIVFLMHIPLALDERNQVPQRERLYELLEGRAHHWSISAHTHMQGHVFLGEEDGNRGRVHHHWNSGTASGSWWRGRRDEYGIPHTTMRDGSPNGYSIVTFEGTDYSIRFKAARRPADHQIWIHAPEAVETGQRAAIYANVFAGSERSQVHLRIRDRPTPTALPARDSQLGRWTPMTLTREPDPAFLALRERENAALAEDEKPLPHPNPSPHLWRLERDFELAPGRYWLEVRSIDMFGQEDRALRALRVEPGERSAPPP